MVVDKELVIFDLDQTLVDTSTLEVLRKNRQWREIASHLDQTMVYPGIKHTVDCLKSRGIKIAVFTSSPKSYARGVLEHHDLHYDLLLGYHDVNMKKPSPEGFYKILEHFNIDSKKAISFGDQHTDILASNEAKIQSVACLWGNEDNDKLIDSKPNLILDQSIKISSMIGC
ncbi:HAD family hydrolase [Myroides odoratus]|uniref:phosphoglycolate phosphatase n=1 Tax=Myroides odoratus TaxID=256 RepID=A0A378RIV3_MYROD|nr:HAD-IIIA family hydrolase [Myroides odoratus]QQU02131.1 HAD-IIIA family hydrolase [Myroides odoratus]STZ26963.1 Phosphoglycolate phosphatase [Myroides odoratus]